MYFSLPDGYDYYEIGNAIKFNEISLEYIFDSKK